MIVIGCPKAYDNNVDRIITTIVTFVQIAKRKLFIMYVSRFTHRGPKSGALTARPRGRFKLK